MKTYFEITIIRSRKAAERENLDYPCVEKIDSTHESLEMAEFNYNNAFIGSETDKELRKITEDEKGVIIEDELIYSTY
jgi:hypothetical protein